MIRVRFAPSPTGYLHIGSARTALFNFIFAKRCRGSFLLRIEDTDQARSKDIYLKEILESLEWLGIRTDDPPCFQSKRLPLYNEKADELLRQGLAYKDDKAIIFKVHPQTIVVEDIIHGRIEFDSSILKDQVLLKSDGLPTYNFACVVDDADMGITDVIRGDDHISNTPKQLLLYGAMRLKPPQFAHIPLILGLDRARLSKRKGATSVREFMEEGYLSEALVNFLTLLGWSPKANRELISIDETIEQFDIKDVKKTAAVFDQEKLNWINGQYIKKEDPERLTDKIIPLLIEKGHIKKDNFDRNYILSLVKLFQGRLSTLNDFAERADFFLLKEINIDSTAREKFLNRDFSKEFSLFIERLDKIDRFDIADIERSFREMVRELDIEAKILIHPVRVVLTGKTVGPGLFEIIYYLGRERVKERLSKFIV